MKYINILIPIVAGVALFSNSAAAQTQINLGSQGRNVDFRNAPSTSPLKSGVALPALCQIAEMFFKIDAAPGSNIFLCVAANIWQLHGNAAGSGSLGFQQNNVPIGSRPTIDALDGAGITRTFIDTGSKITDQIAINSAVILTRVTGQSNADRVVALSSSGTCALVGTLSPALASYPSSEGMEIHLTPNNTCAASGSLALNGLAAKNLYEANGITAITLTSGLAYALSWDPALNSSAGGWKKLGGSASASDLTSGTLPPGRLPLPAIGALGGTQSITCSGTNKLSAIGADGIPVCTADIAGTTSASDLTSGTLPPGRLPLPAIGALGGTQSIICSGTSKLSAIGADGVPVCTAETNRTVLLWCCETAVTIATPTVYGPISGSQPFGSSEPLRRQIMSSAGTIGNFKAYARSANASSTGSLTCTVMVNNAATALEVVLAGGAPAGTILLDTDSVSVTANDYAAVRCVSSGANGTTTISSFSFLFTF